MKVVFRARGYEGTSIEDLAAGTTLNKASLYHRFPEGKVAMAAAVLDDLRNWSAAHLLTPLSEPGDPHERLVAMTRALEELYVGGHEACLIGLFSSGEPLKHFGSQLRDSLSLLIHTIEAVLLQAGIAPELAYARAEDAVIRIQGSLVVVRVLQDTGPFVRLLQRLPDELLYGGQPALPPVRS